MKHRMMILLCTAAVAIFLLLLQTLAAGDPARRNYEFMPEMVHSVGYESFSSHPNLAAGMTLQPLVEGTVVRGHRRFPYAATPEDAERAGRELANPFAATDTEALTRGAEVYRTYCITCHDAAGAGQGAVVLRGVIPPPSLLAVRAREMRDGQMYHLLTLGQGNMASYAIQVVPKDRWKVILHVRSLQTGAE